MPEPVKGNGRYMAGLDGLRALAVLAVIAYHLNLSIAPGGLLGVGVFFVLSGYLITDLLVAEWQGNRQINLKNFWLRRARRLLPALCIMLVAVGGWVTLFDRAQLAALRGDVLATMLYASNWWFVFHHVSYFARFGLPHPSATCGHWRWRSSFTCSVRYCCGSDCVTPAVGVLWWG
ncbi:acyltransferase [Moorella naiadis]